METVNVKEKEYKEERFEFTLYVNENIICKRNFKIFNYVEGSMQTMDFKYVVDDIVSMIDNDLKSKSRVYTWYWYDPEFEEEENELNSPLIEPWACTFKFVVTDNKREVISKIWDGYAYPKQIRENVDLANKFVKVITKEGETINVPKEEFFETRKGKLTFEQELLKSMIIDKPDLISKITKKICETCSPSKEEVKEKGFVNSQNNSNYLKDYEKEYSSKSVKYKLVLKEANKKVDEAWDKLLLKKTKEYFRNLY